MTAGVTGRPAVLPRCIIADTLRSVYLLSRCSFFFYRTKNLTILSLVPFMLYNLISQTVQLVILQKKKSNEVKEVSRKGITISKWDTNLQASYLRLDLDNAKFSGSSFWVEKHSQLECPCSKSLRIRLLFSENTPNLEGHWYQHFSMEEKKIIDTKSFLQTSVKSKIMTVGGHNKEENLI